MELNEEPPELIMISNLFSILNNIRNGRYNNLLEEYQVFSKFYNVDFSNFNVNFQNVKKEHDEYYEKKEKEYERNN